MALQLGVQNNGNQSFRSSFNNNLYSYTIQWNDRNQRFYMTIQNISTGTFGLVQQLEPFSTITIDGLDYGEDHYLLPILVTPAYNPDGSYNINYTDIGSNLQLYLVNYNELDSVRKLYGSITNLSRL